MSACADECVFLAPNLLRQIATRSRNNTSPGFSISTVLRVRPGRSSSFVASRCCPRSFRTFIPLSPVLSFTLTHTHRSHSLSLSFSLCHSADTRVRISYSRPRNLTTMTTNGEETTSDRNVEIWKIKKLIKSLEMARG